MKTEAKNKELEGNIEELAKWCEGRNNIQPNGNEFAPSFIKRIRNLTTSDELERVRTQNAELLEALKEVEKTCLDAEEQGHANGWIRDIKDIVRIQIEKL